MANAIMLVFSIFCIYTLSLTGDRRYYTSSVDLQGKTIIVTGNYMKRFIAAQLNGLDLEDWPIIFVNGVCVVIE